MKKLLYILLLVGAVLLGYSLAMFYPYQTESYTEYPSRFDIEIVKDERIKASFQDPALSGFAPIGGGWHVDDSGAGEPQPTKPPVFDVKSN